MVGGDGLGLTGRVGESLLLYRKNCGLKECGFLGCDLTGPTTCPSICLFTEESTKKKFR